MKNTFVDVSGKLPAGLVELYSTVLEAGSRKGISFLVVGAMARDLVLHWGFGSRIERGTRDVDFGIDVATWEEFDRLAKGLEQEGLKRDSRQEQKFHFTDSASMPWEIDIVPFGGIADARNSISWPPDGGFRMSVLGFDEAMRSALRVRIATDPVREIAVASPAGITLLKLISWLDREVDRRAKDAQDLLYLIQTYAAIPDVYDSLYTDGFMETWDWDQDKASAAKLGNDVGSIALPQTLLLLRGALFSQLAARTALTREMKAGQISGQDTGELLAALISGVEQTASE